MYPKTTLLAAEFMRDIAIIWIDHGEAKYWNWTEHSYRWMRGDNEAHLDFQEARNLEGQVGGFYAGIQANGSIDRQSTSLITAACTEGMLYALFINVPEFERPLAMIIIIITLTLTVLRRRKQSRLSPQCS
jgi:hypothetical protein